MTASDVETQPDLFTTILHPTDFSENSRPAFQTACGMARDNNATLLVLHIIAPSESPLAQAGALVWGDDGTVHVPDPRQSSEAQRALAELPWPEPSGAQVRVERRLAEGDPADEILRLTKTLSCDLVVMGTHGKTGLGRLLTGSVAENVLRKADCPVLVVKAPERRTPEPVWDAPAKPGEKIDVRPLGAAMASAYTGTLVRTAAMEVVRLIVRSGQEIPHRKAKGELIVHCLEGQVALTALGKTRMLEAGQMLYLPAGESHSLDGIEDSALLLTTVAPKT
jgi:nucleotide-binding universal stress UspA family protein/quercetin dioxygenase-like cupin family protein